MPKKKIGKFNLIQKHVCTLICHCGWNIHIGGDNVADLIRIEQFLSEPNKYIHEDKVFCTADQIEKRLKEEYDKGYNKGLENVLADSDS